MIHAAADDVRAAIAATLLGPEESRRSLGEIRLHQHQVAGVERVRRMLKDHGGALLADDVGLGKTFVALAIARDADDPLVIAPAAVRDPWRDAASKARVDIRFVSMEQLSRGGGAPKPTGVVIVDEAHHLRSPATRRFAAAAALCSGARVLLMTATPVQNRITDLRVILSLFLGERAYALSEHDLAPFVIRRVERNLANAHSLALPTVLPPQWVAPVCDVDCLDRLLKLPSPLPPIDGEDGGVLLSYTLARQWASSRAALRAALRGRLARARAMEDAISAGRYPDRREVAAWCYADGVQQLTFPELTVAALCEDRDALLDQLRTHADGVRELLAWLGASPDPDVQRARALTLLLQRHAGERVVAFAEYAETVAMLFRALRNEVCVAALTHGGAQVAGGPITRRELLDRFALPDARMRASERVDLLLTTDVLSEGVNLQSASVAVHLDLSWNPARLEQRVGRLRRLGAARQTVAVYLFAPPAPAERLLQMETRLRAKLTAAARSMGLAGAILPGFMPREQGGNTAEREERIAATLRAWRNGPISIHKEGPLIATVDAPEEGAIACVACGGGPMLVALRDGAVTDDRTVVQRMLENARGAHVEASEDVVQQIVARFDRWLRRQAVSNVLDLASLRLARTRRAVLERVDSIARRAPRHQQPRLASLIHVARAAAAATLPAGAEHVLTELARADMRDEAWLQAMGQFASLHARRSTDADRIIAMLVLKRSQA